jgi:Ni/Fe-hydrogenase subunit HybB-like protein
VSVDYTKELPLITARGSLKEIDEAIARPMETKPDRKWYIAISITLSLMSVGGVALLLSFIEGTGLWGNNNPVYWGFPIVNFVFWVGIGHAGTLISAILYLFRQKWRNAIARFAEAMTIFAVMTAGIFPLIHTGRVWLAGYLLPYPNERLLWVNFRSPLEWDVFAVSTYLTVSLVFWYVGLIPDFATMRERATTKLKKMIYTIFSLGWRHSNRHWQHYERMYLILAGLATPLVLSVHTVVSFDFAVSVLPGWHTTIFPPYFVAGAIFSGFAMVITVMVIVRKVFDLEHLITLDHLERINKILMTTGLMVGYAYAMEFFIAWYSGNPFEQFVFINRAFGPYAWAYWIMISCNVIFPQLFWFKKMRRSIPVMFMVSITTNIGMWFERYVITVTSLHRDFLISSWDYFVATTTDFAILIGSFGFFFTWVLLFTKSLPVIAIAEIKAVSDNAHITHGGDHHE